LGCQSFVDDGDSPILSIAKSQWIYINIYLNDSENKEKLFNPCRSNSLIHQNEEHLGGKRLRRMTETIEFRLEQVQNNMISNILTYLVSSRTTRPGSEGIIHSRRSPSNHQKTDPT